MAMTTTTRTMVLDEYESGFTSPWLRYCLTLHISPEKVASEIVRPDAIDVKFSGTDFTNGPSPLSL